MRMGLQQTLIAENAQGSAILFNTGTGAATLGCCDLWGNPGGDWTDRFASQYGVNGNISADPMFCADDTLQMWLQPGTPCAPPVSACGLIGAWMEGCDGSGVALVAHDSPDMRLAACPDPASGWTHFSYRLPADQSAALDIYSVDGRSVRRWVCPAGGAAAQSTLWDGRDGLGRLCPTGLYLARLSSGRRSVTTKVLLLR